MQFAPKQSACRSALHGVVGNHKLGKGMPGARLLNIRVCILNGGVRGFYFAVFNFHPINRWTELCRVRPPPLS